MLNALRASVIYSLVCCSVPVLAQEKGVSLEDLEQMGSELDQANPSTSAPEMRLDAPAIDTGSSPAPQAAPSLLGDMSQAQSIDVRSRMKKVLEPNLFAGAPPMPGTLRNLAMGEAPEEYEVQEGDNLFDICDQLLDEGGYWPKLWAFNPSIANPHFVYPGMRLRFYAGDADNPPYLRVVTEDDIVPVNKGDISESELVREDISGMLMRSELHENMPVIGPNELEKVAGIDDMFVDVGNSKGPQPIQVIIPAFVVEDEFPVFGSVVGGSAGSILLSSGDEVIIEQEDEGLREEASFTVVRESGKIYTPNGGDYVGRRYEFIGQIQIKSREEDYFRGRVSYSRLGIEPGDLVIPYRSVKRSLPMSGYSVQKGANQEIIGFDEPMREIAGRGSFVFIDQSQTKLQEGVTYQLLQNVQVVAPSFIKDNLPDTSHRVARVYVLDVSGSAALAYVISDAFEVRLGDRVAP